MKLNLLLLTLLVGCKEKTSACETESFEGTPFFSTDGAAGGVSGEVTWPNSVEEGLIIEFGYESSDGALYMGAVGEGLFDLPSTCGNSMGYSITGMAQGDYRVVVKINESLMTADTGVSQYLAEGRSDVITIGDSVVTDIDVELFLLD